MKKPPHDSERRSEQRVADTKGTSPLEAQQDEGPFTLGQMDHSDTDMEKMSEITMIPNPTVEKHLVEVENLKWQIEHERKMQHEMNMMLQEKVSNLMANKEENSNEIEQLNQVIQN